MKKAQLQQIIIDISKMDKMEIYDKPTRGDNSLINLLLSATKQ